MKRVLGSTQLYKVSDETAIRYLKELEDKYAPVTVKLQNNSYGADGHEWTFEGGGSIEYAL